MVRVRLAAGVEEGVGTHPRPPVHPRPRSGEAGCPGPAHRRPQPPVAPCRAPGPTSRLPSGRVTGSPRENHHDRLARAHGDPLSGIAEAAPLDLTYEQALEQTVSRNPAMLGAQADVNRRGGGLALVARALRADVQRRDLVLLSTNEGTSEFGNYFADTSGWRRHAGLSQTFPTGTTLGVDLSELPNRFSTGWRTPSWSSRRAPYQSSLAFTLSQAVLEGHRLAWNLQGVRAANGARSAAEAARQSARQDALANTATAYWSVRTQVALVAIAEQTLSVSTEQHRVVLALVEAGRLAPVEATRAEAAKVQAERALIDARSAHAAAQDALLLLLGEAPGQERRRRLGPRGAGGPGARRGRGGGARPPGQPAAARRAGDAGHQADGAGERPPRHAPLARGDGFVRVRGYESDLAGSFAELGRGDLPEWSVGASLSMPLYNRADRGAVGQAEADVASTEIDLAALDGTVSQQARAQVRTLEAASRYVSLAALNVRLAEETLGAERARFDEGRGLQKDVIAAIEGLDAARVESERARAAWQDALVALRRLEGRL